MRWLLLLLALTAPASADLFGPAPAVVRRLANSGPPAVYLGVIDQEPTTTLFGGLMAGSAALATAQTKLVDLSNNTTTCIGVKSLTTGQMDLSVGLYCNGATQTVTTWCSTNCTVASGVARVTKVYEQIGGTITWTSASYAVSPFFVLGTVNGNPSMLCVSANSTYMSATISAINNPMSLGATYERTSNFTNPQNYNYTPGGGDGINAASSANTTQAAFGGAGTVTATATDGSSTADFSHFHNVLGQQNAAGNQSSIFVDGAAAVTNTLAFGNGSGTTSGICGNSVSGDGFFRRLWFDNTATTAGQAVTNSTNVGF